MNHKLHLLAGILSYPQHNYKELASDFLYLADNSLSPAKLLQKFKDLVKTKSLPEIEELFASTFEMNKNACLEIGWHLYGEDYNRGDFLVKMRQALQEFSIAESVELPDHLSHCLHLLAALEPPEAQIFSRSYILKALEKILSGLDNDNPYHGLLQYLKMLLYEESYHPDDVTYGI
jgi:nitrate reductase delta subunit